MDQRAEILWKWFTGKTDCYALQQPDGSYVKVDAPLTLGILERHVRGEITVAVYLIDSLGRVQFGVIDFDSKSPQCCERLVWIKRWLEHLRLHPLIASSGNKGYHLWVLFKNWIPAEKIQRLLRAAVRAAEEEFGLPNYSVEVFPKQINGKSYGNCIKLPWGIHRKTGKRTTFLEDNNV